MEAISNTPGLKNETKSATRWGGSFGLRVFAVKNLLKKMGKESEAEVSLVKIEKESEAEELLEESRHALCEESSQN